MYICLCKDLKESDVERVAMQGTVTPEGMIAALGWDDGSCCGRCVRRIDHFVALARRAQRRLDSTTANGQQLA